MIIRKKDLSLLHLENPRETPLGLTQMIECVYEYIDIYNFM